eukprot:c1124_g1_i1 orf=521-853(+)
MLLEFFLIKNFIGQDISLRASLSDESQSLIMEIYGRLRALVHSLLELQHYKGGSKASWNPESCQSQASLEGSEFRKALGSEARFWHFLVKGRSSQFNLRTVQYQYRSPWN